MLKWLLALKLSKDADPKKFGKQIAVKKAGYNCKIDKIQKTAVVVSAAGKIYAGTTQQKLCLVWSSQFLWPHKGLPKLCITTIVSKEERTQARSTKMAETATTTMTGTLQLWLELINRWAENASNVEKKAIVREIVLKDWQMMETEILLTANVLSVAHMVIER